MKNRLEEGDTIKFLPLELYGHVTKVHTKENSVDILIDEGENGHSWIFEDNCISEIILRDIKTSYLLRINIC